MLRECSSVRRCFSRCTPPPSATNTCASRPQTQASSHSDVSSTCSTPSISTASYTHMFHQLVFRRDGFKTSTIFYGTAPQHLLQFCVGYFTGWAPYSRPSKPRAHTETVLAIIYPGELRLASCCLDFPSVLTPGPCILSGGADSSNFLDTLPPSLLQSVLFHQISSSYNVSSSRRHSNA